MSLLVLVEGSLSTSSTLSILGVFSGERLVGLCSLECGACGLAVWGDDPTTTELDGACSGESLTLKVQTEGVWRPVEYATQFGDGLYSTDGLWVVRLTESAMPLEYGLAGVYPNPFNSVTRVSYRLAEASRVELGLFDVEGRFVRQLVQDEQRAGVHSLVIEGVDLAAGVYVLQLRAGGALSRQKVTLIK
jgi:hypothetical protein